MLPVLALFFSVELAVALTAIVHFLNNLLKLALLGRHAVPSVVLRFGLVALLGAYGSAEVLLWLSDLEPIATYRLGTLECRVTPVKLTVAALLVVFASIEMVPALRGISFETTYLPIGGFLSGFFGGLSGHQGALRSAFLIRCGLTKEQFLGTGVVIACMVDASRLAVYAIRLPLLGLDDHVPLVMTAIVSAFAGTLAANYLLPKVTLGAIQTMVSVMLFGIALALGTGVL